MVEEVRILEKWKADFNEPYCEFFFCWGEYVEHDYLSVRIEYAYAVFESLAGVKHVIFETQFKGPEKLFCAVDVSSSRTVARVKKALAAAVLERESWEQIWLSV